MTNLTGHPLVSPTGHPSCRAILMRTRPIYHSSDAAIRGHVFCSFLALILRKELDERGVAARFVRNCTARILARYLLISPA
jgi:hypothetical protein